MVISCDVVPELKVGFGDGFGIAVESDFTVFDEDGAGTIFCNVAHVVSDENDGLVAFDGVEIVGTFLLKGGVTDGEDFV